jgi:hypothetical protein
MGDGGRDREKAEGRKRRERGGGKKLRGTGEMSRRDIRSARRLRKGEANCTIFYFIYLFSYFSLSIFQTPPIAAGALVLGPLLPSRSPVPFLPVFPDIQEV